MLGNLGRKQCTDTLLYASPLIIFEFQETKNWNYYRFLFKYVSHLLEEAYLQVYLRHGFSMTKFAVL